MNPIHTLTDEEVVTLMVALDDYASAMEHSCLADPGHQEWLDTASRARALANMVDAGGVFIISGEGDQSVPIVSNDDWRAILDGAYRSRMTTPSERLGE